MLGVSVSLLGIGLLTGALAPLLVQGRRNMPMAVTMVLGVLGSLVGGGMGYVLFGRDAVGDGLGHFAWMIGAILGAVLVLLLFVAFGRRPATKVRSGVRRRADHGAAEAVPASAESDGRHPQAWRGRTPTRVTRSEADGP